MARVGAVRMAQNTHRTELILMFQKIVCWFNFEYKMLKNIAYAVIRTHYLWNG